MRDWHWPCQTTQLRAHHPLCTSDTITHQRPNKGGVTNGYHSSDSLQLFQSTCTSTCFLSRDTWKKHLCNTDQLGHCCWCSSTVWPKPTSCPHTHPSAHPPAQNTSSNEGFSNQNPFSQHHTKKGTQSQRYSAARSTSKFHLLAQGV